MSIQKKPNILVVSSLFPPEIGGPATYVVELSKRLKSQGFGVKILTLAEKDHPKENFGLEVSSVLRSDPMALRQFRLLKEIFFQALTCDVIYALDIAAIGFPCVTIGKLLGKRVLVRYAGDTAWEKANREGKTKKTLEEFLKSPDSNKKILDLEKKVLASCNFVVTPAKNLKNLLVTYYSVPESKVFVTPNSIDISWNENPHHAREISSSSSPVIIMVGRLVAQKQYDNALRSFVGVLKIFPKAKLLIVGDGPEQEKLFKLTSELELKGKVEFLGRLEKTQIYEKLRSSDVFVLNSIYEGMSHTILEAMACGVPIIVSNIEANQEIVKNGLTGITIPAYHDLNEKILSAAIVQLVKDKKARENLSRQAFKYVKENHSWDNNVSLFTHLLSKL